MMAVKPRTMSETILVERPAAGRRGVGAAGAQRRHVSMNFPVDLWDRVGAVAERRYASRTDVMIAAVLEYLQVHETAVGGD